MNKRRMKAMLHLARQHTRCVMGVQARQQWKHRCAQQLLSTMTTISARPDSSLVDGTCGPVDFDHASAVVYPDVVSVEQESRLMELLEAKFRRSRYQNGHWDSVIQGYRETDSVEDDAEMRDLLQPLRHLIEARHNNNSGSCTGSREAFSGTWLPYHAIDLKREGELRAHVDSVRYSGNIVAGLSLQSSSIMMLRKEGSADKDTEHVDLLLPPRSLYVLSGTSRYDYTHELKPCGSLFPCHGAVLRDKRLSIILRDTLLEEGNSNADWS